MKQLKILTLYLLLNVQEFHYRSRIKHHTVRTIGRVGIQLNECLKYTEWTHKCYVVMTELQEQPKLVPTLSCWREKFQATERKASSLQRVWPCVFWEVQRQ